MNQPSNWEKPSQKTIYTLCVNNYAPRIRELTMPLMTRYAEKIGADLVVITERKRPEWPVTIEKFQVAEFAKQRGDDWSIFIDADTLISPEFFDPTVHMDRNQVAHNGSDFNGIRWKMDPYFQRDGRWWGSCTWFVAASDWTVEDLWQLPTLEPEECWKRINITVQEYHSGNCDTQHLIDDYTLSRNIARYGLKAITLVDICQRLGFRQPDGGGINPFLWHVYTEPEEIKLQRMLNVLSTPIRQPIRHPLNPNQMDMGWGLMSPQAANEMRERFALPRR